MNGETLVISELARRVLSPDFEWTPYRPGVDIHRLYGKGESGPSAALLQYAPGARIPQHSHPGYEHIFVLHGTQVDIRGTHSAGTLVVNPPGSSHDVISPGGCVVLVIWERPVAFSASAG
ncbi:MAG TPA: cupin domain-containing protein [Polyangia bacterium]